MKGIGRKYIGDMFAAIGSRTKAGKAISSGARAMAATAPAGMVTPAAMSAHMRPGHIKAGKRIAAAAKGRVRRRRAFSQARGEAGVEGTLGKGSDMGLEFASSCRECSIGRVGK